MLFKKAIVFCLLCSVSYIANTQLPVKASTWAYIDSSVRYKKNVLQVQQQLLQIKQQALAAQQYGIAARCWYYIMQVDDERNNDTLFFKNSSFIDSILNVPSAPSPLKLAMYMLQAKRIEQFRRNFNHQSKASIIAAYNTSYSLTGYTNIQLDSLVTEQYKAALRLSPYMQGMPVDDWLWLSSNPFTFLFKPGITDIIYQEWINNQSKASSHLANTALRQALLLSQDDFISLQVQSKDFTDEQIALAVIYRQWMAYHSKSNPGAYYSIETLARKNFYSHILYDSVVENNYEHYLLSILQSPYTSVKATAIQQLFMLWVARAANYNTDRAANWQYNDKKEDKKTGGASLPYYAKAITLFNSNKPLLDSFRFMRNTMQAVYNEVVTQQVQLQMQQTQLPGKPIATMLFYRNLPMLYMRIIRLSARSPIGKSILNNSPQQNSIAEKATVNKLLQLPAFIENQQALPFDTSYQWHNTFVKLDSLPAGNYALLYAGAAIGSDTNVQYLHFTVTGIATLNNDDRLFVLNRATGFPIQGTTVKVVYKNSTITHKTIRKTVNAQGYVTITESNVDSIIVINNRDTVLAGCRGHNDDKPGTVYDPDEYDDKEEYYEDKITLHIFTGRAIYRPGQTVYYKIIGTTYNPRSGEMVILNEHNLKLPFFKKIFASAVKKFLKEDGKIYIQDAFNKKVDSFQIKPNKFGSFSGSYKLSPNAATGDWDFDAAVFDIDNNSGFKVEEYKRPTFTLTINPPAKELYAGDSFTVVLKVRSFAGALLSNVRTHYTVTRGGHFSLADGFYDKESELLSGDEVTDSHGEIVLHLHDTTVARWVAKGNEQQTFNYSVTATATDETGETDEASKDFSITNQPILFSIPIQSSIDVKDVAPVYISASTTLGGKLTKKATVKLYKVLTQNNVKSVDAWPATDVQLYSDADLQQWFPGILQNSSNTASSAVEELIYTTNIIAGGDDKLTLPVNLIQAGNYRLEISCTDGQGKLTGFNVKPFEVYNKNTRQLPGPTANFNVMPYNTTQAGSNIVWLTGNTQQQVYSIYHAAYYTQTAKGTHQQNVYDAKVEQKGLNEWVYKLPGNVVGNVRLTHLFIINNQLYSNTRTVYLQSNKDAPQIIVQQYRQVIAPGTEQTFTVSVKTNDENAVAELMTTMYDAALDKIEPHNWHIPYENMNSPSTSWEGSINSKTAYEVNNFRDMRIQFPADSARLWWLGIDANRSLSTWNTVYTAASALMGRLPGLSIDMEGNLNEVVVVGYGTAIKRELTGSIAGITIRGASSLANYSQPLIILDGEVYTGNLTNIDTRGINAIILQGADAAAVYGSRAAQGVLIISTKGPVVLPKPAEAAPPPPVIRKNFAETAFFYPQVHAGRDGYYTISFTLPQSVTAWKWKMLAHTVHAQFAYAEKDITSNLPLMVQPAMPKFLYQGDKMVLRTRVTNLDTTGISGTLQCSIEDAVTGEDITSQLLTTPKQPITVGRSNNTAGNFTINVPANLLHPLRIKVAAATKMYSDAEEHIIPVLAKKILVTQNIPVAAQATQTTIVPKPTLPADAEPYGVSLYITPKPQGALINSLPYLANYAYDCAEQTFNKLYAHTLAIKIARTDTAVQRSMLQDNVQNTPATNDSLPAGISEESMPWLQASNATAVEQQNMRRLFDTAQAHEKINEYFTRLTSMQNSDGGVSWFPGGKSDFYVSCYLLSSLGKLRNNGMLLLPVTEQSKADAFIKNLASYCNAMVSANSYHSIEYLYAVSFAEKNDSLATTLVENLLAEQWHNADNLSIGRQAMLITATLQLTASGNTWHNKALAQLQSLQQLAVTDDNGTRWKAVSNDDDLNSSTEEQVAKLTEAYEVAGISNVTNGVISWLLQNRQQHSWGTTKSTAEVINMLHKYMPNITGADNTMAANNINLYVTNNLFGGNRQAFANAMGKTFTDSIGITTTGSNKVTGGINYYYFTATPPLNKTPQGVALKRTIQRQNNNGVWELITDTTNLNIADKIKITLHIQTPKALQYVFIEDKHAATFETQNAESGYSYESGISYYASYRDAGVQFFAEAIPAGNTSISYEAIVAHTGSFTGGPASLQCMYAPGVHAYSNTYTVQAGSR